MAQICVAAEVLIDLCGKAERGLAKRQQRSGFQTTITYKMEPFFPDRVSVTLAHLQETARQALQLGGQGHAAVSLTSEEARMLEWAISS